MIGRAVPSQTSLFGLAGALLAIPACHEPAAPDLAPEPAAPTIAAAPAVPSARPDAGPAPVEPPAFDEPVLERRVFREILVGALVYPPLRRTWTFTRGATRARLEAVCQRGKTGGSSRTPARASGGLALNGEENDPPWWLAPAVTIYDGAPAGKGALSYRLSAVGGLASAQACAPLPDVVLMACRPAQVSVLRRGAALIVEPMRPTDEMPASHWAPASAESVAALRCEVRAEGDAGDPDRVTLWHGTPFVLAAGKGEAPGVEFAFENSDMVVQRGAYRWMPAR
jgi:hypothetical protein